MRDAPRYPFVHIAVSPDEADAISGLLFGLGASGVEERDQGTLLKAPEGAVLLVASFDDHPSAEAAIAELRDHDPELRPTLEEVVGDEWRDAWKEHFKPFSLTPSIVVRPPWCEAPEGSATVLELEPGRAFGTGLHATTSLVANALDASREELSGKTVLDAGTGSGILSLVALVLGASRAIAFDVDPDVIGVVMENAERNGLADRVEARAGTIEEIDGTYPWVVANIEARVLDPIAEALVARVAPGGRLVLSGILSPERERMIERYTGLDRKVEVVRITEQGDAADGWVALDLRVS